MKRSGRLTRRTPLRTRTPLRRSSGLSRRSRLRSVSPSNQRSEWADVKAQVRQRAERMGTRCEATAIPHRCLYGIHYHHILPRGRGGTDTVDNTVQLCGFAHRWVHDHPEAANKLGLLDHSWEKQQ